MINDFDYRLEQGLLFRIGLVNTQHREPLSLVCHKRALEQHLDLSLECAFNLFFDHVEHFLREAILVRVEHEGDHGVHLFTHDELHDFIEKLEFTLLHGIHTFDIRGGPPTTVTWSKLLLWVVLDNSHRGLVAVGRWLEARSGQVLMALGLDSVGDFLMLEFVEQLHQEERQLQLV